MKRNGRVASEIFLQPISGLHVNTNFSITRCAFHPPGAFNSSSVSFHSTGSFILFGAFFVYILFISLVRCDVFLLLLILTSTAQMIYFIRMRCVEMVQLEACECNRAAHVQLS